MTAAEAFLETAVETTTVPVSDIAAPEADTAMEVHQSVPERGTKRAAEDEPSPDAHKKARTGMSISSCNCVESGFNKMP